MVRDALENYKGSYLLAMSDFGHRVNIFKGLTATLLNVKFGEECSQKVCKEINQLSDAKLLTSCVILVTLYLFPLHSRVRVPFSWKFKKIFDGKLLLQQAEPLSVQA
jgi:hypothetical protein